MSGGGPGRPPKAYRFRKGTSGNPKGRPSRLSLRGDPPGHHRGQRRISLRNENVAALDQRACAMPHQAIAGGIVDGAARQAGAPEAGGGQAMDMHPVDDLFSGKHRARFLVKLPAGDDVHDLVRACQIKREVADDLARSGMIRVEEAIEENDAGHCPERVRSRVRGRLQKNAAAFF